jgi:tripartite-type tricarboxylate transporter receptor subunit TctC
MPAAAPSTRRALLRSGGGSAQWPPHIVREDRVRILGFAAALAVLLAASTAPAQQDAAASYPNRPVKIIVSTPAGGGVDTVTRIVAEQLTRRLGQPFVVDNRAGAGGNVGAEAVHAAEPDGYTLLASQPAPLTTSKVLYAKLAFDPAAFEPIAILAENANVLLVRPDFPARDAAEFLAHVKANPGKLNYGSQGIATTAHLTAELFDSVTGTRMTHVPYKGTAPALNDLIASHIDLIFMELPSAYQLHESGKARILAVATKGRIPSLKDIPTLDEAGVRGFVSATWTALSAPPKTPQAIVAKLNAAINAALKTPEVKAQYDRLNNSMVDLDPAAAGAYIRSESKLWSEVIRAAKVQPQ